jgi:hypothetical protein
VKNKIGQEEYDKLRGVVLHHQETFVEQLYDLHRLVRRQQHLEANCRQRPAYNAELQRLVSISVAVCHFSYDIFCNDLYKWLHLAVSKPQLPLPFEAGIWLSYLQRGL